MIKRLKNSIPILITLAAIAIGAVIVYFYTTGGTYYNYDHLIPVTGEVQTKPFEPLVETQGPQIDGMVAAAENEFLILYVDPDSASIAVHDKRNSYTWYSNPLALNDDPIANDFEKEFMNSLFAFRFFNNNRGVASYYSRRDSARLGQSELLAIPNGLRIDFTLGTSSLGLRGIPEKITLERLEELIERVEDPDDQEIVRRWYHRDRRNRDFTNLSNQLQSNREGRLNMIRIFEEVIGYTYEDLLEDNEIAGLIREEILLVQYRMPVDFVLDADSLIINIGLSCVETENDNLIQGIELMRYFGAGSTEDDGYLFVPSGSGALIEFNNGKTNHERFTGIVYGVDMLGRRLISQIVHDIKLPVFGLKNDDAAMFAVIENGSALATINADVSGRVSSFNSAWFNFILRETDTATMRGTENTMTVLQEDAYEGDITVRYIFLADDDAGYAGMARAYQNYLVNNNVLMPLEPEKNSPFYLSFLGAIEKQEFILGTPYYANVPMTTYSQATEIVELLNKQGVESVEAQWIGWFNRGANHDVANKINPVRRVGTSNDRERLTDLLQTGGGELYPAVRFQALRWDSRRLSMSRSVTQDILGYSGIFTSFNRQLLSVTRTMYRSDAYALIHPRVIPFHVDGFISAYNSLGNNRLALEDIGGFLTQSLYRNHSVDRESSKFIMQEQIQKLYDEFGPMMISAGNDYSFFAAGHMIDLPMTTDRYLILDHSIPFIQMVLHGYIDHSGTAINTRENYDYDYTLLSLLSTGCAPHFLWTYEPTMKLALTQYDVLYSTQYETWIDDAVALYKTYNEVFSELRTAPITDHIILRPGIPGSIGQSAVTMTQFGTTRIYVNFSNTEYVTDDIMIPPMNFFIRTTQDN